MKLDWCKDSGQWNIWDIDSGALLAKVQSVQLLVPAEFVTTDGGRHGYCVVCGVLTVTDGKAVIRRMSNGNRKV
jgi:hypothetical protein